MLNFMTTEAIEFEISEIQDFKFFLEFNSYNHLL